MTPFQKREVLREAEYYHWMGLHRIAREALDEIAKTLDEQPRKEDLRDDDIERAPGYNHTRHVVGVP